MLQPTKHENLDQNLLVIGADILKYVRSNSSNVEELFQYLKEKKDLNIEKYFDALTFLWLNDFVQVNGDIVTHQSPKSN